MRHLALLGLWALASPVHATAAAPRSQEPAAATISIAALEITGSSIASRLERAARPHLGRAADAGRLKLLAADLAAAYARSDIAIYAMDLNSISADGRLAVKVREGHVESLRFTGGPKALADRVRAIAASLRDRPGPLSKGALNRTLRLIQAIPGGRVEASMAAGTVPGGLEIHFNVDGDARRLGVLLHNGGQPVTGRAQLVVTGQGNGVIRAGDQMTFQMGRNLNGRGQVVAAAYSLPLGSRGASLDMSAAASASRIPDYRLKGDARDFALSLTYPLLLDKQDMISAAIGLGLQESESRLAGYRLFRERSVGISASLRWQRDTARTASGLLLKATRAAPFAPVQVSAPVASRHFTKLEAQANHDRLLTSTAVLHLRVMGQYSPDALTQGQGVALGGQGFGRAYDPAILVGDSAIGGSLELVWAAASGKTRQVQLYGAVDAARAYYNERLLYRSGRFDLASAGGGVRIAQGPLNVDLSLHRALVRPYPGYDDKWRAMVSIGFTK